MMTTNALKDLWLSKTPSIPRFMKKIKEKGKFLIFVDDELEKRRERKGRKKRAKRARENETKGREGGRDNKRLHNSILICIYLCK